jgi:hypothetical protein
MASVVLEKSIFRIVRPLVGHISTRKQAKQQLNVRKITFLQRGVGTARICGCICLSADDEVRGVRPKRHVAYKSGLNTKNEKLGLLRTYMIKMRMTPNHGIDTF